VQTTTDYVGGAEKALALRIKIKLLLLYNKKCGLATARKQQKEDIKMSNDNNSLSHTKWNCKYHIVFAPKYRRKIFFGEKKTEIGQILRERCNWKQVSIIEAEICPDHIHMLVEIPPKMSVSSFMGFLKGKSSLIIHERHANLKYKHGNRSFWCRGYFVDTVGKNTKKITEYIQRQLEEDKLQDQLTFREYEDPFKGSK
jgi:putative transposase